MISFFYQLLDWIRYAQPHFFVVFFIYVWVVWTIKVLGARRYEPAINDYTATTSVVIPVYQEDPEVLRSMLSSIANNNTTATEAPDTMSQSAPGAASPAGLSQPSEILVVVDGGDEEMAAIAREFTNRVWQIPKTGKREALRTAIPETNGDIVIIVDSDTIFTPGAIANLIKPFDDPTVGGVTTSQRIFDPDRTFCRHCADWMEFLRFKISTPAQSSFGTVGCLPGRAIAIRRSLLLDELDDLMHDNFLGIRCEIGDDRALTNFTLKRGYRTVFQSTALVYTDAPDHWGKFTRQQLRWARSSQRETLKSLRWLVHKPFLMFCFITDILTPFILTALVLMVLFNWITGQSTTLIVAGTPLANPIVALAAAYLGAIVSIGIRQIPRFRQYPRDVFLLPVFVLALTFILVPVRIAGFMTMGEQNWITRRTMEQRSDDGDLDDVPEPGQRVTPRVWAVRGLTVSLGLSLLLAIVWFGLNFQQQDNPYAIYREQIQQVTGQ